MNTTSSLKNSFISTFKIAFPYTIPVLTGFLTLGMAYGILMQKNGFSIYLAVFISAIAFCGSMQFLAITLLVSTVSPLQAFLLSIMVNARHIFYGISMLQRYKGTGKFKPFLIYTLCDETFSISSSIEVPINYNKTYFYFWISFLDYIYWIIGTFLGCLLGNHLTFNTTGLDFALTALFVVLFMEQLQKKENILPGLIGIFTSIISLILFGSNQMIIPSMILIIIILLGGKNKICKPY